MRIAVSDTPWVRACLIASLLIYVRVAPAGSRGQSRTASASQPRASSSTDAGRNDPCTVAPATASNSAVPLAQLLNRTKSQMAESIGSPSLTGVEQGDSFSKEVWSSRVAIPELSGDDQDSLDLKRLIRQVRSVKFAGKTTGPTFTAPTESASLAMPTRAPSMPISQTQESTPMVVSSPAPSVSASETSLSVKAQRTLGMLQQNPDQVRDALDMAELLFLSGRATDAAPFYAKSLDQLNRTDPSYDADRAWVLFQLGNCLRETDIAKAQDSYMRLVSEYPASPWTELAKAHGRLLTWYQKSRPEPTPMSPQL